MTKPAAETTPADKIQEALARLLALSHDKLIELDNQLLRITRNPGQIKVDRTEMEKIRALLRAMAESKAPSTPRLA